MSRLAVLKEYRQYSFGRELVEALHKYAVQDATKSLENSADATLVKSNNVIRVVSHSQIPVKAFYAK